MTIAAMASRMSVLTRALPRRILLVIDDEHELSLLAGRIEAAGFAVTRARHGEEALVQFARQWFPVVISDWQMPIMDGLALTQALRARGVEDTYIIVLSEHESSVDYERGYSVGVDDYLTKRLPDAELFARIHVALNTLALRRSLQDTQAALANASPLNAVTGAFTPRETLSKLQPEIHRAQRYGRTLSVLTMGVRIARSGDAPSSAALAGVVRTLQGVIRTHIDWVGHIDGEPESAVFAIVLPEAAAAHGPKIKERMRDALATVSDGARALEFDFGLVSLERGAEANPVEARDLIAVAEQCRACPGYAGPPQLSAVQRSVAAGVTIACRHGYAVERRCTLKADFSAHRA